MHKVMLNMLDNSIHVATQNLAFCYKKRVVFNDISISIPRGKIVAIMGPSGTGKTTLLKLIAGQLQPDEGCVLINGINIHTLSQKRLYQIRRDIGFLFQSGALFTNLNVYENVAFPLREHTKLSEILIRNIVLMKLQIVGLRGAFNLMPSQLSGGMARRVALARAIALDPNLILYDEPLTGLDPIAMGVILKLIKDLNSALGLTTVIVSHNVAEISTIADYSYVIANGKIVGQGTPASLQHNDDPAIKQFIHGLPDGIVPFHYPASTFTEDLFAHVE